MDENAKLQLLAFPEVVEEIKRHLWIESEKAGYDLGFEWAANDWINRFGLEWLKYNQPDKQTSDNPPSFFGIKLKTRRAKSYTFDTDHFSNN